MPALRGIYLTHPTLGTDGLWFELSTNPVGTYTGLAKANFPAVGSNTLAQYTTVLTATFQRLCNLPNGVQAIQGFQPPGGYVTDGGQWIPAVIILTITLSSISPVTISGVTATEGVVKQVTV